MANKPIIKTSIQQFVLIVKNIPMNSLTIANDLVAVNVKREAIN
jgi:hypothetical protein